MRMTDNDSINPGQLLAGGLKKKKEWNRGNKGGSQRRLESNTVTKSTKPVPQCRGALGTFWAPWTGTVRPSGWKSGPSVYSARPFQPEPWRDPARWLSDLDQSQRGLVSGQSMVPSLGAHCPEPTRRGIQENKRKRKKRHKTEAVWHKTTDYEECFSHMTSSDQKWAVIPSNTHNRETVFYSQ